MNGTVFRESTIDDLVSWAAAPAILPDPALMNSVEEMLHQWSATSEGFAYGSTALAAALTEDRRATIAANVIERDGEFARVACWHCRHNDRGIDLVPRDSRADTSTRSADIEVGAAHLVGDGGPGDILIVCDPWGESDLLCWSLRFAAQRRMTTVAITSDLPNFLTALADHAVRVPATPSHRQEIVVAALRFLVQTAGSALEANRRRATRPLNPALLP